MAILPPAGRSQTICPVHMADACAIDCGFVPHVLLPLPPITVGDVQAAVLALVDAAMPVPINEGSRMERDLHIRLYDLIDTAARALTASTEEGSLGDGSGTSELEALVDDLHERVADVSGYAARVASSR